MGFSVSGATAVILVAGLLAFSVAFTAANNGFERVSTAHDDRAERLLAQQNSAIEIADASYDGNASRVSVTVNNTGSTELSVGDTALLVDGAYRENVTTSVDGDGETDVWLPGEQLQLLVDATDHPERVKVIVETGVADTTTEVSTSG